MIILKNAKLITMDEKQEREFTGDVVIDGTKIVEVGRGLSRDGAEEIDLTGYTVTPGIIDAHCHIGMFEDGMGVEGDDGNEMSDPSTPEMRAIDAINPFDRCFVEAMEGGVTTCVTGPGSANVVGGAFAAIKTHGRDVEDMLLRYPVGMKAAFGENPKRVYQSRKSIFTRMQTAAILRKTLTKAIEYEKKLKNAGDDASKLPERDLAMEAMLPVIRRELPLKIHAHRADDILTALRIAKEFNLRITLDHCTEGYLITDLLKEGIKETGAGVIIGPLLSDRSKIELRNLTFKAAKTLYDNGIEFAMMTDHPVIPEQYLPICAGLAAREGLPEHEALRSITINAARITGLDDRIGSIEKGKDADIAVFNGDPLQTLTRCVMTIINGKICHNEL
ncbi:MAG: amidohydrolase [Clostridiales bacterium]|nr:amidohydrolase [Clostridiales bacterium]